MVTELTCLSFSLRQQFDRLEKLCNLLERAISKEAKRRRTDAQYRYIKTKDGEERAFLSVGIDDGLYEIEHDFPRIMRYSLFVNMMSVTEASLVRLCRVAHRNLKLGNAFCEKGGDVVRRALKYLRTKVGLDTSKLSYYEHLADNLRKVRNAITHSEGCIEGRQDERDIRKFVDQRIGVRIDKRKNIVLSRRFVVNNARGMSALIARLSCELKKRLDLHTSNSTSSL